MDALSGEDVTLNREDQRHGGRHRRADPVSEGRDVDLDALASVDGALPVQREVVAILRDQHESQQVGAGAPAGNAKRESVPVLWRDSDSQLRQLNFSRTCSTTFQVRGTHSRLSVTSSPSFLSAPPHFGQEHGAG
jgi:hypothetical protein